MSKSGYQLGLDAAQLYEAQKVPAIFQPLAERTLESISLDGCNRVLDVACGTGIVARLLAGRLGPRVRIDGVDLNGAMIAVARKVAGTMGAGLAWHEADVGALPFDDGVFDLAICQQGLQFFPDRPRALGEMRRVLAPRGRLVLTVWKESSALFQAMAEALRHQHLTELADQMLSPFAFNDGCAIRMLITEAGFGEVSAQELEVERRIGPVVESVPREFAGSHVAEQIAGLEQGVMAEILRECDAKLRRFESGGGLSIPQRTHLFVANAS